MQLYECRYEKYDCVDQSNGDEKEVEEKAKCAKGSRYIISCQQINSKSFN